MPRGQIFVGRQKELDAFRCVLADPQGQAVLIIGQEGMGKTMLANRMAEEAETSGAPLPVPRDWIPVGR